MCKNVDSDQPPSLGSGSALFIMSGGLSLRDAGHMLLEMICEVFVIVLKGHIFSSKLQSFSEMNFYQVIHEFIAKYSFKLYSFLPLCFRIF